MSETDLLKSILAELCKKYPLGLWHRRNVAAMKTQHGFIRFGLPGMADISGILPVLIAGCSRGLAIEIEVKTAKGIQSPEQKNWQRAVERAGGVYILTRSVEDCLAQVDRFVQLLDLSINTL
jgi:hypothetical protein